MLNDPLAPQTATRAPRLRVMSNGQEMPGAVSAEVTLTNDYHSNTFEVELAVSAGAVWDVGPPLVVEIDFSIDGGNSWVPQITGEVDNQELYLEKGSLRMSGRDLTSRMTDKPVQNMYQNQTSSQVATQFAAANGLKAQVSPTTTLIGRYYEQDHTSGSLGQFSRSMTQWDLLTYLAQREGYDCYVQGSTLYFQPSATASTGSGPYIIQWTPPSPVPRLNAISVVAQHSMTLAQDMAVQVKSYNSHQARGFTRGAYGSGKGSKGGTPNTYVYIRPNLTEDQAQQLASKQLTELSKHERTIDIAMPGELVLTPQNMVQLQGTGTSFDQVYFIQTIQRTLSFEEGFRQSLKLKNSSPRTVTTGQTNPFL